MRRVLLAATVLAALLLSGCGIPDDSGVQVLGAGPSAAPAYDDDTSPVQPEQNATTDPSTFVDYYLQAAAGDPDGALDRVKKFLAPEARAAFKPQGAGLQVVHLAEKPLVTPGSNNVQLTVQTIGTLQDDGSLVPSSDSAPTHLSLVLATRGTSGLFVTKAPPALLLTDTALSTFYQLRTIYFWNNDNTGLVPDVRYMPLGVPAVQQPTTILNWLVGPPADWLKTAVKSLPQSTTVPDNIPAVSNDRLQIRLSAQAVPPGDDKALDRLRQQLQWSLRPLARTLELTIGNQNPVSYTDAEYLSSNSASRLLDVPERFVIFNGVIRRLSESSRAVAPVPLIKPEANHNIQSAALSNSTTHTFAAVVTGSGASASLRAAAAPTGQEATLKVVRGVSGRLGHPVWAVTSSDADAGTAVGLIIANGRLYSFAADGSAAQPVEWQGGDPGALTAVSVAPDGHRVALVAGGKLYRTVLTVSGDGVVLASPDVILPPTLRSVAAVAWSSEQELVVAGVRAVDNRVTVTDVTIDGVLDKIRLQDIGTEPVTYLSAYPASPTGRSEIASWVSYVAGGQAWDVSSEPLPIATNELAGPAGSAPPGTTPTAPFYLD